jgi:hypothetical protein
VLVLSQRDKTYLLWALRTFDQPARFFCHFIILFMRWIRRVNVSRRVVGLSDGDIAVTMISRGRGSIARNGNGSSKR